MKPSFRQLALAGVAAIGLGVLGSSQAQAVNVGLELSLLIDVSGSVDANEFALQKQGYVNAFNSAAVQNAILNSVGGSIAVNLIQWSGATDQSQSVGWTLINSVASAQSFAALINGIGRDFANNTAPGSAINFAAPLFTNNGFEGARRVIDVSGDGAQNEGADTATARNDALAGAGGFDKVDAINGLPILGEAGLLAWYQNNIQGGAGSFTTPAADFNDFSRAIEGKLVAEIIGTPEPATMAILGVGLLGLGIVRRRKSS